MCKVGSCLSSSRMMNVISSPVSVVTSTIDTLVQFVTFRRLEQKNTPMLIAEKEILTFNEYEFTKQVPYQATPNCVTLDRRVIWNVQMCQSETHDVLVLDVCEDIYQRTWKLENYARVTVRNIGAPLKSVEIELVEIELRNGKILRLLPAPHRCLTKIVDTNSTFDVFISYFQSNDSPDVLFNREKIQSPDFVEDKKKCVNENYFNTYTPISADLFSCVKCYLKTTSYQDKPYHQCIEIKTFAGISSTDAYLCRAPKVRKVRINGVSH